MLSIACHAEYSWLPCHYTCDEVRRFKARMLTHDETKPGVDVVPSDVPVETLTLARGIHTHTQTHTHGLNIHIYMYI